MSIKAALVVAVAIIAAGGVASRAVHVQIAHHQVAVEKEQDARCARWDEAAGVRAYNEASAWRETHAGTPGAAGISDYWLNVYRSNGAYPDEGRDVPRPSFC